MRPPSPKGSNSLALGNAQGELNGTGLNALKAHDRRRLRAGRSEALCRAFSAREAVWLACFHGASPHARLSQPFGLPFVAAHVKRLGTGDAVLVQKPGSAETSSAGAYPQRRNALPDESRTLLLDHSRRSAAL